MTSQQLIYMDFYRLLTLLMLVALFAALFFYPAESVAGLLLPALHISRLCGWYRVARHGGW